MIHPLITIFERDLNKLSQEISTYQNQSALWMIERSISNSAGNLTLHICGNLQHFIGAVLGNSGYIRERDQEFVHKNVLIEDLLKEIEVTIAVVKSTLHKLDINSLESKYPINVFKKEMTTEFFLLHLTTHLSYHLGQINYHRRILDGEV